MAIRPRVHVALRRGGAVASIDPVGMTILSRTAVCAAPRGVAYDPTADAIYVACASGELVTLPAAGGSATRTVTVAPDLRDAVIVGGTLYVSTLRTADVMQMASDGTVAANLARPRPKARQGVVGANIGANKDSDDRIGDYVTGLKRLWGLADYFTVNVSSPNTPGLRALQTGEALAELLGRVAEARAALAGPAPVFLKVAPDLDDAGIEAIAEAVAGAGFDGVIVGNTTLSRPDDLKSGHRGEAGGLSGAPLMSLSTRVLGEFHAAARGRFALIGAGGIASGADAYAKVRAGAAAVQLYSALVFKGPSLVTAIRRDLAARLKADGFASLAAAVGAR